MSSTIHIECLIEPNYGENALVISHSEKRPCWIVDPGLPDSVEQIMRHIGRDELQPQAVLITHGHLDHIAGLPELREKLGEIPIYIANEERAALTDPNENLSAGVGMPIVIGDLETRDLPAGGELTLDGVTWRILDTSGHSPGGRSFYCADAGVVIVGDALFQGSIGRVDFHHSNPDKLLSNIHENLLTLPGETRVYCGHGPTTTIGEEKQHNMFLQG